MRHVSARTQPHSVTLHHIRSSSKIRYFFDFFAHPRFLRTLAHPPQTNALSHPPSHTSAKPLSGIVCRPIACGNTGSGYAIAPNGAIRSAYRPISPCGLNTGSLSPYFALWAQYGFWSPYFALWAQYGLLVALFRPMGSIRAFGRPISPNGLNTGSGYAIAPNGAIRSAFLPGVALRFFTRGCATLHPGLYSGAPSGRSIPPHAQFLTSAVGIFAFVCHLGNP